MKKQYYRNFKFSAARCSTPTDCIRAVTPVDIKNDAPVSQPENPVLHGHNFSLQVFLNGDKKESPTYHKHLFNKIEQALAELHMCYLNDTMNIDNPTDRNIVSSLGDSFTDAEIPMMMLKSTDSGSTTGFSDGSHEVCCHFSIESAHFLPQLPVDHKCHHLHGHTFRLHFHLGFSDNHFESNAEIRDVFAPLIHKIDHCLLNEIKGLENPTAENLARYCFEQGLSLHSSLKKVTVFETENSSCSYEGEQIWNCYKVFDLQSAVHSDSGIYGHSYDVTIGIRSRLDHSFGWTMDFGDIKKLFSSYRSQLDHHCLSDIDGEDVAEIGRLARWIFDNLGMDLPKLYSVDIRQGHHSGVILENDRLS